MFTAARQSLGKRVFEAKLQARKVKLLQASPLTRQRESDHMQMDDIVSLWFLSPFQTFLQVAELSRPRTYHFLSFSSLSYLT
jgi:hypothetical protein